MPVFALKASRTFWNESCSLPPHRDVTVIVPPAPPLPGAAEPPPPHAPTMKIAAIGSARIRGNLAIGLLLLTDGGSCQTWPVRAGSSVRRAPTRVGQQPGLCRV